jgi:hypothetical protein
VKALAIMLSACSSNGGDSVASPDDSAATDDTATDDTADDDGFADLEGRVYVQKGQALGFASYAFAAETEIYIDYTAFPSHVTLDDGAALPPHKAFVDTGFAGARTFTGTIDWEMDGSTLGGDARWVYEMVFAADYSSIESGTSDSFLADGTHRGTLYFGTDLIYVLAE